MAEDEDKLPDPLYDQVVREFVRLSRFFAEREGYYRMQSNLDGLCKCVLYVQTQPGCFNVFRSGWQHTIVGALQVALRKAEERQPRRNV